MDDRRGWVNNPPSSTRSTATLLYGCFFTIFICTWTALHLNIASQGRSRARRFLRQVQWTVVAVLLPDYVTLTALSQREAVVAHLAERDPGAWPRGEGEKVQGFYTCMGGFELHFEDDGTSYRLTFVQLCSLIDSGVISTPTITVDEIEDKSKGNWVSKSIVVIQIVYFIAQVIGRAIQHLQVTPLELFTIGITMCTFVSYVNWWDKPLDVGTSTSIQIDSRARFLSSLNAFYIRQEKREESKDDDDDETRDPLNDELLQALNNYIPPTLHAYIDEVKARKALSATGLDSHGFASFIDEPICDFFGTISAKGVETLSSKDLKGLRVRGAQVSTLRAIDREMREPYLSSGSFLSEAFFPGDRDLGIGPLLGICLTCLVFGACHVVAWTFSFPSYAETMLWKVTSVGCVALPFVLLPLSYFPRGQKNHSTLNIVVFYTFVAMYFVMRIYLLVDVFVSLRSVPASVYVQQNWSLYVPHFG